MTINNIQIMLDQLNEVREKFLSLPDDMLLNIDPRNNESLTTGVNFIKEYNDTLDNFIENAERLTAMVEAHFSIDPEESVEKTNNNNGQTRDRIIAELDKTEPHYLEENFTYKRPYGFVFGKAAYKGIKTWRMLYVKFLQELANEYSPKMNSLPNEEKFISNRGKAQFSDNASDFRVAAKINSKLYTEVNLSANSLRDNMKSLLQYVGHSEKDMKIYLREDRDAE